MYEGWASFGCTEILNASRAYWYSRTADCPIDWLRLTYCDNLADALNDGEPYHVDNIEEAPWYDEQIPATKRFYGAYPTSISGLTDSTRTASITEGILDGGVISGHRHAVRTFRSQALLIARGQDALEAGLSWLDAALEPDSCSMHGDSCGELNFQFFNSCPPRRSAFMRDEVVWTLGARNLATNPSFETTSGTVEVYRNLATNPSFEADTAATVEVRRNLVRYPNAEAGATTGWVSAAGAAVSSVTTQFHSGTRSYQVITTGAAAGEGISQSSSSASGPQPSGVALTAETVSLWVLAPAGASLVFAAEEYIPDGAFVATRGTSPFSGTGAWQRVSVTSSAKSVASNMLRTYVRTSSTQAITFYVDDALSEVSPVLGTYFDGSTLPAGDFSYAWTGTANASASVQYGLAVPTIQQFSGRASIQSSEWAASGGKSARIIPTLDNVSSANGLVLSEFSPLPDGTYTVAATVRLSAAQTGTLHNAARRIIVGNANSVAAQSAQAPNAAGVTRLSLVINKVGPTDVRLTNGAPAGGGDVWWDDICIVKGVYTGPYFDGSTPAKVRRNLITNPALLVNSTGWTLSGNTTRVAVGGALGIPALSLNRVGGSVAVASIRVAGSVSPGETLTASAIGVIGVGMAMALDLQWYRADNTLIGGPRMYLTEAASASDKWQTVAGVPTRWSVSAVAPAGASYLVVRTFRDNAGDGETFVTQFMAERGPVMNAYFDGAAPIEPYAAAWEGTANASPSYLYDADLTPAWTGTANASASVLTGVGVAPPVTPTTTSTGCIQSSQWASTGINSLRIIPTTNSTDTYYQLSAYGTAVFQPGKTYTVLATVRLAAPQTGTPATYARTIQFIQRVGGTYFNTQSASAPNAAGSTELRHTFTVNATATEAVVRLRNGASAGNGDVWWDDLLIVEGEYDGPYFDGDTEDEELKRYSWLGAPNASASLYEEGTAVKVFDPVAYENAVDSVVRNLHGVVVLSGPTVVEKLRRDGPDGGVWGYIVEIVFGAGNPFIYSLPRAVELPPSAPSVVQDIPFNLATYPSAELAGAAVVVATNYSTNPSLETNATDWGVAQSVIPVGNIASARATIAEGAVVAVGNASYRRIFTAVSGGSNGWFGASQTVTIPTTANLRFSISMWAQASATVGSPTLGTLQFFAEWRNGSTVLRTDNLGSVPITGGAVGVPSILPPAGANNVVVSSRINVTSWATGNVIRLHTDALAVTVP